MSSDDTSYYRKRARTERGLALLSENAKVAAIHEELARSYEALASQEQLRPTFKIARPRLSISA